MRKWQERAVEWKSNQSNQSESDFAIQSYTTLWPFWSSSLSIWSSWSWSWSFPDVLLRNNVALLILTLIDNTHDPDQTFWSWSWSSSRCPVARPCGRATEECRLRLCHLPTIDRRYFIMYYLVISIPHLVLWDYCVLLSGGCHPTTKEQHEYLNYIFHGTFWWLVP